MRPEEHNAYLEPRCTQLRLLKQTLRSLREQKDLVESIKESNLRAAETANLPDEAERIRERYLADVTKIESAIRRAEVQMSALQRGNPCRLPEGTEA
jgi:hypothetical protein